ncbi:extracellular solute-binding protein [Viridibacterium curvum]|uniref:extracellular solute-binding protein n=1 Tax=Viridibacterium curvum TaxID=1101404 RepID=UPI0031E58A51
MRRLICIGLAALLPSAPSLAAHAYAQFGDIKYPAGFKHFEWVNPDAPKGGSFSLAPPLRITNFDKYNPFTLKGNAPPGLSDLVFESLLTGSLDEPTTAYGLLAEDISVAGDGRSVTFRLNPAARFQDGSAVLAIDVKYSFDRLMSKEAHPAIRAQLGDVRGVVVTGERSVRIDFAQASAELPLLVGSMPVFSHKWGAGKPFDKVVMDAPIASGPYRISGGDFGRDITYERDTNYWARDLNVRRGMFNFDRVTFRVYKDNTAQTEAFKAGQFDYVEVFIAREWARTYKGKKFDSGELIRRTVLNRNAGDFQGFVLNSRRPQLADVRVRQAIALAMDFEWMNRQFFYNSYTRVRGFFNNSDFEAKGKPAGDELALLESLRDKLPAGVLNEEVTQPPSTAAPNSLRGNLREARRLMAEAGWTYRDGALRNARGDVFTLEFLDDSGSMARIINPYMQALGKLGVRASYRQADFALVKKRQDVFDFDVISLRTRGSEAPGSELRDRFSSKAAATEGSGNLAGVRSPAADALLEKALAARTRPELVASLRALDRVLRAGHYVVPHWTSTGFRIAYRAKRFGEPAVAPQYFQPEDWTIRTWWSLDAANKNKNGAKD